GDDLGRNARVVAVSFDQAVGALGLEHATRGLLPTNVFGVLGAAHFELGPLQLQRFRRVVVDQHLGAVLGALLLFLGYVGQHFVALDMRREFLVARWLGLLFQFTPHRVFDDDLLGFRRRR